MTQKEIDNFLTNIKVYVNGKSKEIQEKLFSFGYCWFGGSIEILHTCEPFIYIYRDKKITYGWEMDDFTNRKNREITADEILSLELDKPKYRPFKNKEECWNEMLKHQPFGWLKYINSNLPYVHISAVYHPSVCINFSCTQYVNIFNDYVFADGTPFGIKE